MARYKDPQTGQLLPEGIQPVVSERTGKVTYRARLSYGPRAQRRHIGKTCPTAGEAIEWRLQKQIQVNRGAILEPSRLTVADYFNQWYARNARDLSGARANDIRGVWNNYIAPAIGSLRMQVVTRAHIQALADHMLDTVSANSQKTYMATVRALFSSALADEVINLNPCTGVRLGRIVKSETATWSPLQLRRFLTATSKHKYGPIWAFMIATGCRSGESRALKWDAVDLDNGTVWIRRTAAKSAGGGEEIVDRTKNSTIGHPVKLEPWIVDVLQNMYRSHELVFSHDGRKISYTALRTAFNLERERLNLPKITMHGLRHSVITMLVGSGISDDVSMSITGHKSHEAFLGYSHIGVEGQRIGTETMARLLGFELPSDTTTSGGKEAI